MNDSLTLSLVESVLERMELTLYAHGDTAIFKGRNLYVFLPVDDGVIHVDAICTALDAEGLDFDRFKALQAQCVEEDSND